LGQERIMPFIFTGFRQVAGSRVFTFENIEKDKTRTKVIVRADINLGRKHGIQLQDWPLLCVEMLEREINPVASELIFDEARMLEYADTRAATRLAAMLKRKRSYRPPGNALPAFAAAV
jgi:hypothetical protein